MLSPNSGNSLQHCWKKSFAVLKSRLMRCSSSVLVAMHMMPEMTTPWRLRNSPLRRYSIGLLFGNVELQEAAYLPAVAQCLFVYLVKQARAVHGMNQAYVGGDVLYLVCLQVPYEVPFYVVGQYGVFLLEFLDMAFAEYPLAGIVGFLYHLRRMVLAHGTKPDTFRQTACDLLYAFGNHYSSTL